MDFWPKTGQIWPRPSIIGQILAFLAHLIQCLDKDHKRGKTQDVRVDPEQGASNTGHAPEVDDEDPKQDEDHGGQGRRLTQGEWSQVSKWKARYVAFQLPPM